MVKIKEKTKHWIDTYESHVRIIYEVDADVYQNEKLTQEEINVVLDLIQNKLGREVKSPILDLACGVGRHTIAWTKLGYEVSGLDYSLGFLKIAKEKAKEQGLSIKFIKGDMRNLPFSNNTFYLVFLLGNSFGYFSDEENEKVIKEVFRVLKENGIFVFDITDKESFLKSFKSYEVYKVETPSFGIVIDERWREWDEENKRINCRKKHTTEQGIILLDTPYSIRLYDKEEIEEILRKVGFSKIVIESLSGRENMGLMKNRIFIAGEK